VSFHFCGSQHAEEQTLMANTEASEVWLDMFAPSHCWLRKVWGTLQTDFQSTDPWGLGLKAYMEHPPAGWAALGKLLSLTSSHGVKILRQTLGVNCQIMSSTSSTSQIPLQMFELTAHLFFKLPVALVCQCKYSGCMRLCVVAFEVFDKEKKIINTAYYMLIFKMMFSYYL